MLSEWEDSQNEEIAPVDESDQELKEDPEKDAPEIREERYRQLYFNPGEMMFVGP